MSYLDRLRNCTYTDPNGTVHNLMFDDVARDGSKKVATFDPPQQDRTEVQDMGMSGTDHAMTLYIIGDNYDKAADAFWAGLSLRHTDDKPGRLAHPRWGDLTVKPLTFTQSEGFVEGMGRAVFVVQFKEVTTGQKFPALAVDLVGEISTLSETASASAIATYEGPTSASDIAKVTSQATSTLKSLQDNLAAIVSGVDELASELSSGVTQAVDGIGALIDAPITMAETIVGLVRLPATVVGSISQKLAAYSTLFDDLAAEAGVNNSPAQDDFLSLTLSASAIAAAEASTTGEITNRDDGVAAAEYIAAILEFYRSLMDQTGPDPDLMAQTVDLLTTAQAYLLDASFGLKSARRRILDHDSDPLSETWACYHDVTMLDQFCKDNGLSDGEFFVLPMGREVVWYA